MCGILCVNDDQIDMSVFKNSFQKIAYRGPDCSRILIQDQAVLAFHRLSIMGIEASGMQPMHYKKNVMVCNGEIYNFRKIKKELQEEGVSFSSKSDCEVILPLYEKYGIGLFERLDAEYACVIYDHQKKTLIASRDPLGIRPLFYGYTKDTHKIAFASEAKALIDFCEDIHPFPIGTTYVDGQFIQYHDPINPSKENYQDIDSAAQMIHDTLYEAVKKRLDSDVPIGFLLSGGLDSSLVCAIAQKQLSTPIQTFAIGMREDAIDLKYAKETADYIGSDHTAFLMSKKDVLDCLEEVIYTLETYDITTIRASIGMYLLCKQIKQHTNIKVLLSGEVSDELFGYKYTDFAPDEIEFQKESEKRIHELYMYDVLRADRCISANSLEARVPFSDSKLISGVMAIDPKLKMNHYGIGKYLLRKAFEKDDLLPHDILMREKAAFSDAVGHSMVDYLKEYAEEKYSDEMFVARCQKYSYHAKPFTKESLLYREIFEKYYPGQAGWITGFWMPNQAWEGCQVDDPSARVLSNYGKSGE